MTHKQSLLDILAPIKASGRPLAVLAGAGVSLSSPSNLLDGRTFMRMLFEYALPYDGASRRMMTRTSVPKHPLHRPGEFLRFEVVMQSLADSGLDPNLSVLNCLDESAAPSSTHFILAALMRQGHTVLTTNFDRLIEIAYELLHGAPPRVAAFDNEFDVSPDATLWKLHGSLSVAGRSTVESVKATLYSMLRRGRGTRMRAMFGQLLESHDLLVIGYSGLDDLDIVPVLVNSKGNDTSLIWVDHSSAPWDFGIKTAAERVDALHATSDDDVVGPDRVWLARSGSRCWEIRWDTSDVLSVVADLWQLPDPPSVNLEPYKFGKQYPDATTAYFTKWASNLSQSSASRADFAHRLISMDPRPPAKRLVQWLGRCRTEPQGHLTAEEQLLVIEEMMGEVNWESAEQPSTTNEFLRLISESQADLQGEHAGYVLRIVGRLRCSAEKYFFTEGYQLGLSMMCDATKAFRKRGEAEAELETWLMLFSWSQHDLKWMDGQRLNELVDELGDLPSVWQQLLQFYLAGGVEVVRDATENLQLMLRYAIDVGDVAGEVQARHALGIVAFGANDTALALRQFVRVSELNRIVQSPTMHAECARYLHASCGAGSAAYFAEMLSDPPEVRQLRSELRPMIWNGYTDGSTYEPEGLGLRG